MTTKRIIQVAVSIIVLGAVTYFVPDSLPIAKELLMKVFGG